MKIFIIECNAEELRANRTIMDSISETLSNFTRAFCGADVDDITKCHLEDNTDDETESEENK